MMPKRETFENQSCLFIIFVLDSMDITLLEKHRLATELATDFDENRSLNSLATEMATNENR